MGQGQQDDRRLQALAGNIPDKHHRHLRATTAGSINGRAPPPLDQWNPTYCGDVDMAIAADGTWYHDGSPIRRKELWQLFAGILRREQDGDYYLVTPVEKCRVAVALHPLIIIDFEVGTEQDDGIIWAYLNAGGQFPVSQTYPLRLEPKASGAAYIELTHGLTALCSRAAWYRLVALADAEYRVCSAGAMFSLA
ncbi:MAG: DUF1285 domain-containing protein [Luminiphilus sp.]